MRGMLNLKMAAVTVEGFCTTARFVIKYGEVSSPVSFRIQIDKEHNNLNSMIRHVRDELQDELKQKNLKFYNLSLYLHRRKSEVMGKKIKEEFYKVLSEQTWQTYLEDLKKSTIREDDLYELYLEIEPTDFFVCKNKLFGATDSGEKQGRPSGSGIHMAKGSKATDKSRIVQAILRQDNPNEINNLRTEDQKKQLKEKQTQFAEMFDIAELVNKKREESGVAPLSLGEKEKIKSPTLLNELEVLCICGEKKKLNSWLNISHFGSELCHYRRCKFLKNLINMHCQKDDAIIHCGRPEDHVNIEAVSAGKKRKSKASAETNVMPKAKKTETLPMKNIKLWARPIIKDTAPKK